MYFNNARQSLLSMVVEIASPPSAMRVYITQNNKVGKVNAKRLEQNQIKESKKGDLIRMSVDIDNG